jgi:hypothetical protein
MNLQKNKKKYKKIPKFKTKEKLEMLQSIQELKENIQQEKEYIQEKQENLKMYREKLSEYNLIKDVAQEILGKIASNENTTISKIYEKFDIPLDQ